ncbi:MAG: Coenzyme F420 hydrogenase/dehydrogenase, beta subunit C-terminal domain, partial [Thermoplasmata archaeon]
MAGTEHELTRNITDLLGKMLEMGAVDAVLVPQKVPKGEGVVQSLATHADKLKDAQPLSFVMPVNSATIISEMTKVAPSTRKIAAVLKSCEIRALIELSKLKQASLDNIIIVGVDCPGTYSVKQFREIMGEGRDPMLEFSKNMKEDRDDETMRAACGVCEYPIPENTDITLGIYGSDLKKPIVLAKSEAGTELLEGIEVKVQDETEKRKEAVANLVKRRLGRWHELSDTTMSDVSDIESLLSFFETCINCHNCMDVCPVCYCRECFFESSTFEYESDKYLLWAERRGLIKMPRDTLLFHLTRLNHMSTSCVGCGMCEQA